MGSVELFLESVMNRTHWTLGKGTQRGWKKGTHLSPALLGYVLWGRGVPDALQHIQLPQGSLERPGGLSAVSLQRTAAPAGERITQPSLP